MKNRAYRFERDIYREEDRRQFHRFDRGLATKSDRCDRDGRRSRHKFNSRDRSRITDSCSQFHDLAEIKGDLRQSSRLRRLRNSRFNYKSKNSHCCTQPIRRGGW